MMKTLKYIVLLTVMLVNVTPYIKDGKVEWKANEAAAQYYTIEDSGMGIWICGSYDDPFITLISRVDCYDLLPSQVSDEEAEFEDCFCGVCGYQKEYCQEPCVMCLGTSTVDEDGYDYNTGESTCKCLCGAVLENCSDSGSCSNPLCPYSSHGSNNGSILFNIPTNTTNFYFCITDRSYSYKMDVYPIQTTNGCNRTYDETGIEINHHNWCSIDLLATVYGSQTNNMNNNYSDTSKFWPENMARDYSTKYNRDIVNNDSVGVAKIHEPEFYKSYGINLDLLNTIPHDGCAVFEYFKNGNSKSGIFVNQSDHCFLIYGIKDETSMEIDPAKYIMGDPQVFIFNTDNNQNHNYELPLVDAVNFPGLFQKITK